MNAHTGRSWRSFFWGTVLLLSLAGILAACSSAKKASLQYPDVEARITQYLQDEQIDIRLYTPEYEVFLKDILLGEHPKLTNTADSTRITQYVLDYLGMSPDDTNELLETVPTSSEPGLP